MPTFVALLAGFAVLSVGSMISERSALEATGRSDSAGERAGCPRYCRCDLDGMLHRVDCSDLGLQEVPGNLSSLTTYLDLSMNNLTALSNGAMVHLQLLEELRLAGNELRSVPTGAFSGLHNLRVLMLQNNQLTAVPSDAIKDLINLQSLRLDANHISSVPIGCFSGLQSLRHLWLDDNSLTEVPVGALSDLIGLQAMTLALNQIHHVPDRAFSRLEHLVVLHLNNNRIVSMGTDCFQGLHSLETLDLNYNSLVEFPTAIRSLSHLKELGFHSNNIRSIPDHAFTGNPALVTIFFYNNPIQSVGPSAFQNLPALRALSLNGATELSRFPDLTGTTSLESLTITGAQISTLPESVCEQLNNLQRLDLSFNRIRTLPSLSGCQSVQRIDLHHNEIEDLEENTFHGLVSLLSLDLSWNRLSSVKPASFSVLPALTKLDLSCNQLSSLRLIGLQSLSHLRLAGNSQLVDLIDREELPSVRVMELPYAFQCCAFVSCDVVRGGTSEVAEESPGRETSLLSTQANQNPQDFLMDLEVEPRLQQSIHCSPAPGPLRPCLHLLGSWLVRIGVWFIATISLVGNILVVLSVFFSPSEAVTPPRLLIGLLALVNGLMGVWSGSLAVMDAWTYGSFWRFGANWESSFSCRVSGFLFVFASQTGLFLLTVAALERSSASTAGDHLRPGGPSSGLISALSPDRSSPALSICLAVCLCFVMGVVATLPPLLLGLSPTSLCLPLPSSSSCSQTFTGSLVLLDSLCFLVMTVGYARLYCRSNKAPPIVEQKAALTRHVAWLLLSDLLLFLPVGSICVSSLLHLPAAEPELVKAVLLLLVPLPAAVNPLLYILFNPQEMGALAKRLRREGGGGGGRNMEPPNDEDVEKQSCDSTQALVGVDREESGVH